MPPEEKTNNNIPGVNKYKIGIDSVFKGNLNSQNKKPEQDVPISAYGVLTNQKYSPDTLPISQNITQKPPESNIVTPKSLVRTYKGDLESAIKNDHLSSINIAIAENKKIQAEIKAGVQREDNTSNEYSTSKIAILVSVLLVIIGIISISAVYIFKSSPKIPVVQIQELPSLITTEFKSELNIDSISKNKLVSNLSTMLNDSQIIVNNLYNIYPVTGTSTNKRILNALEFVTVLDFNIPDIIKRTLLSDFMVGTFSFGKNLPFIILKTSYFENAYAGMLAWEVDLEKDMQIIFRLPGYETRGNIADELTPTLTKRFNDSVIVNKDVRILKDKNGEIILLYGIIDKETIIITVNDTAFKELIDRLNKERSLKR